MKRYFLCAVCLLLFLFAAGCSEESSSDEFFAMDTVMSITAYGEGAKQAVLNAENEIYRIDKLLSITSETGDIFKWNNGLSNTVSEETRQLIKIGDEVSQAADGAFNIRLYTLMETWGFYSKQYYVPTTAETEALAANNDGKLDLGGIAKGYASDMAARELRSSGVDSAILRLGGNIYAVGKKPDGGGWVVAIQDPSDTSAVIGTVSVSDKAVVTSGAYQRYFEVNGQRYHHILDPKTGRPSTSDLASITILCDSGALADALSTAVFVMGLEKGSAFWRSGEYGFDFIAVDNEGGVFVTQGAAEIYSSDLEYEVISR